MNNHSENSSLLNARFVAFAIVFSFAQFFIRVAICVASLIILLINPDWVMEGLYPWSVKTVGITLFFVVPACFVLVLFRKGKATGLFGLWNSAFVIETGLIIWAIAVTHATVGFFWMIAGLLLNLTGVIAVAIVAAALDSQWVVAGQLSMGAVIVYLLHTAAWKPIETALAASNTSSRKVISSWFFAD